MYTILLLDVIGVPTFLVLTLVQMTGKRIPLPVWAALPTMIVGVGLLGSWVGMVDVYSALEVATLDARARFFATGYTLATVPLVFATASAAVLGALSAAAISTGTLSGIDDRTWTPAAAALAGTGAIAAGGVMVARTMNAHFGMSAVLGAALVVPVALGVVLSNMSTAADDEQAVRTSAMRLGTALMGCVAVVCWGTALFGASMIEGMRALESAPADVRLSLLTSSLEAAEAASWAGYVAGSIVLVSGVAPSTLQLSRGEDARGVIGGVLALVCAGFISSALPLYLERTNISARAAIPLSTLELLDTIDLPRTPVHADGSKAIDAGCIHRLADGEWVEYSGWSQPLAGECTDQSARVNTLVLSTDQTIGALMEHIWGDSPVRLELATGEPKVVLHGTEPIRDIVRWSAYTAAPVWWVPFDAERPEALEGDQVSPSVAAAMEEGELILISAQGSVPIEDPRAQVTLEKYAGSAETVALIPDSNWTIQETLEVCDKLILRLPRPSGHGEEFGCSLLKTTQEAFLHTLANESPHPVDALGSAQRWRSSVSLGAIEVEGELNTSTTEKLLRRRMSRVQKCHEDALESGQRLEGSMTISLEIGEVGRVVAWEVSRSNLDSSSLETCVGELFKRLRFPRPRGGKATLAVPVTLDVSEDPRRLGSSARGKLDKSVIRRVVTRNTRSVKLCYERGLAKNPKLAGKVTMKFIVGPTGSVDSAVVADSTLGNSDVESCIAEQVKTWIFPEPQGGGVVVINYPFVFSS